MNTDNTVAGSVERQPTLPHHTPPLPSSSVFICVNLWLPLCLPPHPRDPAHTRAVRLIFSPFRSPGLGFSISSSALASNPRPLHVRSPPLAPLPVLRPALQPTGTRQGVPTPRCHRDRGPLPLLRRRVRPSHLHQGRRADRHRGQPREPDQPGHPLPQGRQHLPARGEPAPGDRGALPGALL